jgi:predicted ATPase
MKIQVKELGAIKEAKIDLDKPLTLFCGQNNTGKTYLAFVIYALTRMKIGRNPLKINIPQLIESSKFSFEIDVNEIFQYRNKTILDIKTNLDTIFGISEDLAEQMFSTFEISFDTDIEIFRAKIFEIAIDDILLVNQQRFRIKKEIGNLVVALELIEGEDYSNILKSGVFDIILSSSIANQLAFYPISNAVIFPVERNSIFTFSRELSISRNILVDQMQKLSKGEKLNPFDFIQNSSNRYPLAIRDGLAVSNDLQNIQKTKSDFYDIACELEEKLLHGTLSVNKDGEVQFVSIKNKGKKLPIHMTASIVKTLSSLIFYLKYVAEKRDLIIIDEPEMNLHPDSQIILTRVFAKLLNMGFRLLISTHSDYIIREFNNLIMISSNKPEVIKVAEELQYDLNDAIKPENVGCYYFHFPKISSKQVMVKEIVIDESGFEIESIDKEINAQNERAMSLSYAINYQD